MKKTTVVLLILTLTACLFSCSGDAGEAPVGAPDAANTGLSETDAGPSETARESTDVNDPSSSDGLEIAERSSVFRRLRPFTFRDR